MSNTCKNCRFWGNYRRGACSFEGTLAQENTKQQFEVEARSDDDQGLECWLNTGPDFGCVHFQSNNLNK